MINRKGNYQASFKIWILMDYIFHLIPLSLLFAINLSFQAIFLSPGRKQALYGSPRLLLAFF